MALFRIRNPFRYARDQLQMLRNILPWNKNDWDRSGRFRQLRTAIRKHLFNEQNGKCCYCGLNLQTTSGIRIDHVAPKSKYARFVYEARNLVAACQYCNEELKKEYDSVSGRASRAYENCTFKIVHPILDNPRSHIEIFGDYSVRGKTNKGRESIRLFELTAERRLRNRRAELLEDRIDFLPPRLKKIINKARKYRP